MFLAEHDGIYCKIMRHLAIWASTFFGSIGAAVAVNQYILTHSRDLALSLTTACSFMAICGFLAFKINQLIQKKHLLFLHRQREFFQTLNALDITVKLNDSKYNPFLEIVSSPGMREGDERNPIAQNRKQILAFIATAKQNYNHLGKYLHFIASWFVLGMLSGYIVLLITGFCNLTELPIYYMIFGIALPLVLFIVINSFETKYLVILGADMQRWPPLRLFSRNGLEKRMQKVIETTS